MKILLAHYRTKRVVGLYVKRVVSNFDALYT